jgi:YgiT-type zinc finger domain-containing protein
MNQVCHNCGDALHEEEVTHVQEMDTGIIIIRNVPALVCERCGNRYYTPGTYDRLYDLVHSGVEPLHTETVPVLDMRQSAA